MDIGKSILSLEERIILHKSILEERVQQLKSDNLTEIARSLIQRYKEEEELIIIELGEKLAEQK